MLNMTTDDGIKISYRVDNLTNPWDGEPETILMLHRQFQNLQFLTPLARLLIGRYQIVRMDMRGRGNSEAPPEGSTVSGGPDESTLFERQAQDAINLMDHLQIEKFHWLGAAGGGMTGMVAAISHPQRLKSLIMIASACRISDRVKAIWRQGEKDVGAAIAKLGIGTWIDRAFWPIALDKGKADPKFAAWNLAQRKGAADRIVASCFLGAELFDMCTQVGKITPPTLLMTEQNNRYLDLEQQYFLRDKIPNAKLIVYEDMEAGLESIAVDRCATDVLAFLDNLGQNQG